MNYNLHFFTIATQGIPACHFHLSSSEEYWRFLPWQLNELQHVIFALATQMNAHLAIFTFITRMNAHLQISLQQIR